jgi:aspartyl-tRNA(Asn)/glutamyl-tRNA(Gln) amidotransferase subunit A
MAVPPQPDLSRIAALDDAHKLFAGVDAAGAHAALQRSLEQSAKDGALTGRTVGLKANIAFAGLPWNAGLGHRADLIADRNAHATNRLLAAGATLLPGLNMDAAALGGMTENPDFGRTANPRAPAFSTGGSSGGSAAAIASGLVDIALGTDTLGSIRIPASWCGVFGLKPTFGLVGRSGIVPLAPSLDVVGPMAAHAGDLWTVMTSLAGPDPDDPDSCPAPNAWAAPTPEPDVRGIRIGIPDSIDKTECEPEILHALDQAREALGSGGADVSDIAMPGWRPDRLRKSAFLLSECEGACVHAAALEAGDILPAEVQAMLAYGRDVSSGKLIAALSDIRAARAALHRSLTQVDALLMPTTPQRAVRGGTAAPVNQADFTALASAAGVPALAVPVPVPGEALPASVQLVGPAWSEPDLIGLGCFLEERLG